MSRRFALAMALASVLALTIVLAFQNVAIAADNAPRAVVSGWIPYYSVKNVIPFIKKLPVATPAATGSPVTCEPNEYSAQDNLALNSSYLFTNKDLMKEVMPFWYTLKSPTLIRDDYTTGNPSWPIADTLCLMRRSGLKIIPTITDGTDKSVLAGYLANAQNRTTIVKSIVDLVTKNNFDGADLDFEGFAFVDPLTTWPTTAPNWITFIKELSVQLHASGKLLSVSSPYAYNPNEKLKGYTVYAWLEIASSIDRLRIMTYDYSVAKPGPIGPIDWTEKTLAYAVSIMPASKVFIGLPAYGRDWITAVNGICPITAPPGLISGAKAATFKMNYASTKALIDQAIPFFDVKTSEMTYSYLQSFTGLNTQGISTTCKLSRTVWYQNDRSYTERMNLVAKYRLGGAAVWTLGMEDPTATTAMRNVALAIAPDTVTNVLSLDNTTANTIGFGESFILNGSFTFKDKSPVVGLPVNIEIKRVEESSWTKITESTSDADGRISIPITIGGSAAFRFTTTGTWERAESVSVPAVVSVRPRVTLNYPVSLKRGTQLEITGTVFPRTSGSDVTLQIFSAGKWVNIADKTTTDSQGSFTVGIVRKQREIITLRVKIATNPLATLSSEFSIVVR